MPSALVVAVGCFVGLWAATTVLCAPVLLSSSVRRLLDSGPADRLAANYLGGVGLFAFVHVALVFAGALVNTVVRVTIGWWFLGATLALLGVGWAVVSFVGPQRDWWRPAESRIDGRIVLGVVAVWYGVWTVALAALFAFAWFLAYYPG